MRINSAQKWILGVSTLLVSAIMLFPPWRQAAQLETDYRKDLGHGFLFRPPQPVPVDCYFVGCKTAPATYFHVLLYRELLLAQLMSIVMVCAIALWIFRSCGGAVSQTRLRSSIRLRFSLVLALLVPPTGSYPFASLLFYYLPQQITDPGEMGFFPDVFFVIDFLLCVATIYLLLTAINWILHRSPAAA